MCKSSVRRAWMIVLALFFMAGAAVGQIAVPQLQNPIAWGWVLQSNVGLMTVPPLESPADDSTQADQQMGTQTSGNAPPQTSDGTNNQPADGSASQDLMGSQSSMDTQGRTEGNPPPTNSPSSTPYDSTSSTSDATAPGTVVTNANSSSSRLGGILPFHIQPDGVKIGPLYLTNLSDSFFYAVSNSPGFPIQTYTGNSISANLVYTRSIGQGNFAVDAREQFSLSGTQPFFNQSLGASYNDQLTERWSVGIAAQFIYFQNSILANPQYLLNYQNGGPTLQTLFAQQRGSTMYESNSIAFSYQVNGRTHITLSPIIGATFLDQQGGWSSSHQFGGAIGVTRDFTSNLTMGVFYNLSHSVTSGVSNSPGWNNQSLGFSLDYKFGRSWTIAGSLAASGQLMAQIWTLTPTGSVKIAKSFSKSSIAAAYTRAEASSVFVSSGFYDQGDISFNQRLGQKINFNVGVGEFRTINAGINQSGKRAGGGMSYQWRPRVSLNASYNFGQQNGTEASNFSPFLGTTNAFSIGVNWQLCSNAGR